MAAVSLMLTVPWVQSGGRERQGRSPFLLWRGLLGYGRGRPRMRAWGMETLI